MIEEKISIILQLVRDVDPKATLFLISDVMLENWEELFQNKIRDVDELSAIRTYVENIISRNLPVIFSLDHLSALVGIEIRYLTSMVMQTGSFYRRFSIPKRSGGIREIDAPYQSLLFCQRWINNNISARIQLHNDVHGFVQNRSVVTNALPHLGCRWLLKIDMENFFPSINIRRIVSIFKNCGYARDVSFYMARLCTLNDVLPQGSAASPALSNLVFKKTDNRLSRIAECWDLKYTRYADDLTFSGKYIPSKFINIVYGILKSDGFTPNEEKTRLVGPKGKKIVTGVSVSGKELKLPKSTKRQLRQEVFYLHSYGYEKHTLRLGLYDPIYTERLSGKLAFWKQIEPQNTYVNIAIKNIREIKNHLNTLI